MSGKINFDIYGMNKIQPIWGTDFINKISQSKMGLNLSRGKPLKYYSSDRIVQLMGNGLLTFIDERTKYSDFFNNKEIINYKNESDLFSYFFQNCMFKKSESSENPLYDFTDPKNI